MLQATTHTNSHGRFRDLAAENAKLSDKVRGLLADNARLRADNDRLRNENRDLRAALDSYVARARSTSAFGPVEMTAGTCIGPRRLRSARR